MRTASTDEYASAEPLRCSAVLTHHWLVRVRGGEKVLESLAELLPDAPIYTLIHDATGMAGSPLARRTVHTSCLQYLPGARRHYPKLLPLLPWAARRMKLPPVDLVVCSDAALAKAMTPHPRSKVVCYCHSPMRYAFDAEISREYCLTLPLATRPFWGLTTALVRRADRRAAQRVDQFVANSRHVAERIKHHYQRDAIVVYPPVDIPPAPATGPRSDFFLCVGYHVPYKRLDLAVDACRQLHRKLVVIGEGPAVSRLKARADTNVEWLGWQQSETINDYYRRAAALLFPGEEDFGIVPVEAMSHGCPVIAYGVGGATETVIDGQTGVWFDRQTTACLVDAIRRCDQTRFAAAAMHRHAQQFSTPRFLNEMRSVLQVAL
jgi:glycosyltransferase involved in cell wall biosynthesis